MNKLRALFISKKPVLITYVPAGDPYFSKSILDAYVAGGADILEIGLPSADPYLDGEIMGGSMKRAKGAGTDGNLIARVISQWLPTVATPPVLLWMCYDDANFDNLEEWAKLGVIDAVLMLGTPPAGFYDRLAANDVALCVFVPWDYSDADAVKAAQATGYIMVPTRAGSTGTSQVSSDPTELIKAMRDLNQNVPIVAGFGIDSAESAARILNCGADGIVVGTKCIDVLATQGSAGLAQLLQEISSSINSVVR